MPGTIDEIVSSIWGQILGVECPRNDASFYALGGTSIMAEQIAARIEKALAIRVRGTDVLRDHELGLLLETIRAKLGRQS
jgi:hypothetical protein